MHDMLTRGEGINKAETAARFGVNERSIQRDIEELRNYFACQEMLRKYGISRKKTNIA